MRITSQSLLVLVILCVGIFLFGYRMGERENSALLTTFFQGGNAEKALALPPMTIRASEGEIRKNQDALREEFLNQVKASHRSLEGVEVELTPDGYLAAIKPFFGEKELSLSTKEQALLFMRGEGFIESCYPAHIEDCVHQAVGHRYDAYRFFSKLDEDSPDIPKLIIVVYGPPVIAL